MRNQQKQCYGERYPPEVDNKESFHLYALESVLEIMVPPAMEL